MTRLERHAVLAELVGEPGDAERGMPEHAGGDAGLLDLRIAVHDAADPAQIDSERPDRPAADDDAGSGAVVGNGVENLARILQSRIDDLERRHDIFGGAQHIGQPDAGPVSGLPRMKASSTSTRGRQKFSCGTRAPSAIIMLSSRWP